MPKHVMMLSDLYGRIGQMLKEFKVMELKELMVRGWIGVGKCISNMGGDYDVVYNNEQLTIEHFKFWADNNWDVNDFNEFLEPIPLTPEILEKNGWSQDLCDNESYDNDECDMLSFWIGEDGKNSLWWHVGLELVIPINYVHELQHALRLCGIEKEIVI